MNIFALYTTATAAAGVLVGVQCFPLTLPADPTLPAITYQKIANVSEPTFSTSGAQKMRVQFDCWAMTYLAADATRTSLIAALNGFRGTINDGSQVNQVLLEQLIDFFDHEALQYRAMAEFYVHYNLN